MKIYHTKFVLPARDAETSARAVLLTHYILCKSIRFKHSLDGTSEPEHPIHLVVSRTVKRLQILYTALLNTLKRMSSLKTSPVAMIVVIGCVSYGKLEP